MARIVLALILMALGGDDQVFKWCTTDIECEQVTEWWRYDHSNNASPTEDEED